MARCRRQGRNTFGQSVEEWKSALHGESVDHIRRSSLLVLLALPGIYPIRNFWAAIIEDVEKLRVNPVKLCNVLFTNIYCESIVRQ